MNWKEWVIKKATKKYLTPKIPKRERKKFLPPTHQVPPLNEILINNKKAGFRDSNSGICAVVPSPIGNNYDSLVYFADELFKRQISFIGLDFNGLRTENNQRLDINRVIEDIEKTINYANRNFDNVYLEG